MSVTVDGVWIGNWFIEHLQFVTTTNYSAIANSHTLQSLQRVLSLLSLLCLYHVLGGWRPSHTNLLFFKVPSEDVLISQSHITTDGQSVSLSWCRAPSWAHDQILITVWQLLPCPWEGALSDEMTGLSFVSQSAVLGQLSVCTIFTFYMCHKLLNTYTIVQDLCQSGLSTADYALFLVASL
jgi:hypothetical protein